MTNKAFSGAWGNPNEIEKRLKHYLHLFGFKEQGVDQIIQSCGGSLLLDILNKNADIKLIRIIHKLFKMIADGTLKIKIINQPTNYLIRIFNDEIIFGENYHDVILERNIRLLLLLATILIIHELKRANHERFAHSLINVFRMIPFNPLHYLPENCKVLLSPFYEQAKKTKLFHKVVCLCKIYCFGDLKEQASHLFIVNENKSHYVLWKILSSAKKSVNYLKNIVMLIDYASNLYTLIMKTIRNSKTLTNLCKTCFEVISKLA